MTADERILPGDTAYITDLGMTGPVDSILGMEKEQVIQRFLRQRPARFEVAKGAAQLQGVVLNFNDDTNKVINIERICQVID
jgi:calcineurin-like phosphoesterase